MLPRETYKDRRYANPDRQIDRKTIVNFFIARPLPHTSLELNTQACHRTKSVAIGKSQNTMLQKNPKPIQQHTY
jgi:hypothetical protein